VSVRVVNLIPSNFEAYSTKSRSGFQGRTLLVVRWNVSKIVPRSGFAIRGSRGCRDIATQRAGKAAEHSRSAGSAGSKIDCLLTCPRFSLYRLAPASRERESKMLFHQRIIKDVAVRTQVSRPHPLPVSKYGSDHHGGSDIGQRAGGFLIGFRVFVRSLTLFFRKGSPDGVSTSDSQIGDVFLVDPLEFFRGRIWASNIKMPILHEVVIGISAAHFTPPHKLQVALS
jgi:hypothetical protein